MPRTDLRAAVSARRALGLVFALWAASRCVLLLAAAVAHVVNHVPIHNVIVQWDGVQYEQMVVYGYRDLKDYVWPPGFIWLLQALRGLHIPGALAAVGVNGVSSLAGALALRRIGGGRAGLYAAAAWCFAPATVFTFVFYTEALFCAFAFWAWERMLRGKWWQMSVLVTLALCVRITTGGFLFAAVVVALLVARRSALPQLRDRVAALAWLILPLLTILGFELYLALRFHDWLLWYHAQQAGWERKFTAPWIALLWMLHVSKPGAFSQYAGRSWIYRAEIVSTLLSYVLTVVLAVRRRWGEATFMAVTAFAFSTCAEWFGVARSTVTWWPWWLLIGAWLAKARRWSVVAYFVVSALLAFGWSWEYMSGNWAG